MRPERISCLLLVVVVSLCGPLSLASAARHKDSSAPTSPAGDKRDKKANRAPPSDQHAQLTTPSEVSSSNLAKELGATGQVDPLAGLGIRNPVCDSLAQIRLRATRLSCEANGSPESDYPASNYGFDVFISTGVTHPIGDFTAAFVTILNGIWLGLIFVLKLTLELLGLAFGINPFGEGETMSRLSASIGRTYNQLTDPWLSALVVCGGIWFAYRGLVQRDLAGSVAGTLAAIAMLVLGLWVINQPRESVGRLASLSNEAALAAISAPQSGSLRRPVGSFAEAMSGTWSRLVEVPFAGLDFSDVSWALSRPPPEAVKRADAYFCDDVGALQTIATYAHLGDEEAQKECAAFARKRYGRPRRVIDLYLRSSPGSHAREALWDYFDGEDEYKAKVAAQGGDGALTRLSMLALFAIGLLGAILLLAWLAIRLFTQAAIAFVLLLAAPFALFFPLLGDAGRRAFKTWGLTLIGSVLAKVIYAAFLSIVLLGISILGRADNPAGSATGFLLSSAFTWAVFLKRADLVGWLAIAPEHHRHGLGLSGFAALGLARKAARPARAATTTVARQAGERGRRRLDLGTAATRRTASGGLRESARALAEQRHTEARRIISAYEPSDRVDTVRQQSTPAPRQAPPQQSGPKEQPAPRRASADAPRRAKYEAARELVDRVEQNKARHGRRWSTDDLERYDAEDRRLLQRSTNPADHAHRAGYERTKFEQLRGPERERAEAEIERARKRDLKRLSVAAEPPGRIAGRPSLAAERIRQIKDGESPSRREHLRGLRRQRRSKDHLHPRRNLSRGA
jgi:hypothetical protein